MCGQGFASFASRGRGRSRSPAIQHDELMPKAYLVEMPFFVLRLGTPPRVEKIGSEPALRGTPQRDVHMSATPSACLNGRVGVQQDLVRPPDARGHWRMCAASHEKRTLMEARKALQRVEKDWHAALTIPFPYQIGVVDHPAPVPHNTLERMPLPHRARIRNELGQA